MEDAVIDCFLFFSLVFFFEILSLQLFVLNCDFYYPTNIGTK